MQIGGRNLAKNSNTDIGVLPLYGVTADYIIADDSNITKKIFKATNIVRTIGDFVFYIPFGNNPEKFSKNLANVPLTISFYIRTNNSQILNLGNQNFNVDTNFKRIVLQYIWTSGNLHFNLVGADLQWFEIHSLKIEEGNKATDWSPAPEDKLDVPTMTNNYYGLWDNTNKKFIDGQVSQVGNNVGIGTTNPSEKLNVNGNIYLESDGALLGNKIGALKGELISYNNSLQVMRLNYGFYGTNSHNGINYYGYSHKWIGTGDYTQMYIDGLGNIGIGTESPNSLFDVYKSNGSEIRLSSNNPNLYGRIRFSSNNSSYLNYGSYIEGTGNSEGVDVGDLRFGTGVGSEPVERMRIESNGNVGIGTTTPSEKLDVNGNVKATSFIKSGGTSSQFLKADGSIDSNTYATQSWVTSQGYLTSLPNHTHPWSQITSTPTTLAGYGITNFTSHDVNNSISNPNNTTVNAIGYVRGMNLFGVSNGGLINTAYSSNWQSQIYQDFRTGQIALRGKNNGTWTAWRKVWDDVNLVNPATQSWVSSNFANQTLSLGTETEGGQSISLSNGGSGTITNYFISSRDGSRNVTDTSIYPNANPRRVRFDFMSAGQGTGGSGNYMGVMTYSPWDGTAASTGDSSYQLAFINETGINGSGLPGLALRKGIDTTWGSFRQVAFKPTVKTINTATYTVVPEDANNIIIFTATNVVVTMTASSVNNIGDAVQLEFQGTGSLTVVGSGATILVNQNRAAVSDGQHSTMVVQKLTDTSYKVYGEIV